MRSIFNRLRVIFNRYDFLYPIVFSLPLIVKLAPLDLIGMGCDTRTHVYKSYVLMEQIKQLPPSLWGSWDWNWLCGYPFLKLYAPMLYYIVAFFSLAFNCTPEMVTSGIIVMSFPLSAVSMYFLAKHLTKNRVASLVASTTYAYVPFHIGNATLGGNPGSLLAFVFMPLALLFAEKSFEISKRNFMILSSLFLVFTVLSNHAYGASFIAIFIAWLLFRRKVFQAFVLVSMTVVLSAFFLVPLVFYSSFMSTMFHSVRLEKDVITSLIEAVLPGGAGIGFVYVVAGVMLLVLKLRTIPSNFKIRKELKRHLFTSENILVLCGLLLMLICIYHLVILLFPIRPFSALAFGRVIPAGLLLLSLVLSLVLMKFDKRRTVIALIIILVAILDGIITPVYYPLQPEAYQKTFRYLESDTEWFRVFFIPSEPVGSMIPSYTGKPVVDGWFFQGHTPELFEVLEMVNKELSINPDKALMLLRYLGVKYVVIESEDPIYGYNYSMGLYESVNSSSIATEFFADKSVKVFKVKDYKPVIASNEVREITKLEEMYSTINEIDNNTIYVLKDGGFNVTSSKTGRRVNLVMKNMIQEAGKLTVILSVNCSSYLLIPVSYSPSMSVKVNNYEVMPIKVAPSFICVQLPTEGDHTIEISIKMIPIDFYAGLISFVALISLVFTEVAINKRCLWKRKRSMHDD